MKLLILLLALSSCATRGLKLSEQIPSLHSEYSNDQLVGFVREKDSLLKENYVLVKRNEFFDTNRSMASNKNGFDKFLPEVKVTIMPNGVGVLVND